MSDGPAPESAWPHLVGGHPALDLANTRLVADGPAGDVLGSLDGFESWAAYAAPLPDQVTVRSDPAAPGVLELARALRASVLAVGAACAAGRSPARHDLRTLRDLHATAIRESEPALDPTLEWTWPRLPAVEATVYWLTAGAVRLFSETPPARLKECDACGFLFLDSSKNRSRRWCSMQDCGTQEKMRRYTARRAAARARKDAAGH